MAIEKMKQGTADLDDMLSVFEDEINNESTN